MKVDLSQGKKRDPNQILVLFGLGMLFEQVNLSKQDRIGEYLRSCYYKRVKDQDLYHCGKYS